MKKTVMLKPFKGLRAFKTRKPQLTCSLYHSYSIRAFGEFYKVNPKYKQTGWSDEVLNRMLVWRYAPTFRKRLKQGKAE